MMRPLVTHITAIDQSLYGLLRNQIRAIQRAGYPVLGISSQGPYVRFLNEDGTRHIPVAIERSISPWRDFVSLYRLYRVLRREKPFIVHTHTPKPGLLGQVAAKLAGVPVIVNTVHGFYLYEDMPGHLRRLIVTLEKLAARCSDVVLFQSREDIDIALQHNICKREKIKFLGNGIDLQQFDRERVELSEITAKRKELGIPAESPVVGFVGRLALERKGLKHFLQAGQALVQKNPNIRLLLVGGKDEGKRDSSSPEIAKEYGLSNRAIFAGQLPYHQVPLMYALMDVLVLPSLFEGLPRSLMEAAAMGVPAVASNVKGNREAITDGVTGALVPLGNCHEMVRQIEMILRDHSRARQMSQAARALAEREFDERKVFDRVLAEYQRILKEKQHPRLRQLDHDGPARGAVGRLSEAHD